MSNFKIKNRVKDGALRGLIYLCTGLTVGSLLLILGYIFVKGVPGLSVDFFIRDFNDKTAYVTLQETDDLGVQVEARDDGFYITSMEKGSPFASAVNQNGDRQKLTKGDQIVSIGDTKLTAENCGDLNALLPDTGQVQAKGVRVGGGIFPLLVTTLMIIGLSLLIALPIGISAAVYLNEYAKPGKILRSIRFCIEILAGIPSIIYGLFGMLLFVRFMGMGFSVLAGACTVAIILLPTIIRTTEETLKTVPESYREGSLGLGATKIQTIVKIVIPASAPGILTAVILCIGRIIGESAALLFTSGTQARIPGNLLESGASLTVQAYLAAKEKGDLSMACSIGVVVILVVILLNFLSRKVGKLMTKF